MKRKDLLKLLHEKGCVFVRHGGSHDLYKNPRTGKKQPVSRHNEIDEYLSNHIINILS
jgi:predicted RNA binding protein YcfA (HicA-like mRNA interferase family)